MPLFPVTFEKGVNEFYEPTALPNGFAIQLDNWEPQPTGGLRARPDWNNGATLSAPTDRTSRGVITQIAGVTAYVVIGLDSTTANATRIWTSINGTSAWQDQGNVTGATFDPLTTFANGNGEVYISADPPDASGSATGDIWRWNGASLASYVTGKAGRQLVVHKNRLFSLGVGQANRNRIHFSNLGAFSTFSANDYIDVEPGDGGEIYAGAVYREGLLIGKTTGLWFMTGSGPDTFQINKLSGGSARGRNAVCATPFGVVVAGVAGIYLWQGGAVEKISDPVIDTYINTTTTYSDVVFVANKVYILQSNKALVFDFVHQAWNVATFAHGLGSLGVLRSATLEEKLIAQTNSTSAAPIIYLDPEVEINDRSGDLFARTSTAKTPDLSIGGPTTLVSIGPIYIQLRQHAGDDDHTGLVVGLYADTGDGNMDLVETETISPKSGGGKSFRHRMDVGSTCYRFRLEFVHSATATDQDMFDIEAVEVQHKELTR